MKCLSPYLLLLLSIAILPHCKDKSCDDREYQAINTVVTDQIPYTSGQTLKFKTSAGDNFSATVDRVKEVLRPDAPLICQEYDYTTIKTGGNLFIEYIVRGSVVKDIYLQVSIFTLRTNRASGAVIAVSDNGDLQAEGSFTQSVQHPSLNIDGKTYENVLEINLDEKDIPDPGDLRQLFYNKTYGVIQYTTQSGLVTTRVD